MTFDELKLAPAILKAVHEQGYETPTPIQAQAIPAVLEGHDLLAGAQTGTGKTAAFTLPMLHKLTKGQGKTNKFGKDGIAALVLTPTRELAAQVEESIRTYGKYLPLTSTVIFGGVGMNPQIDRIRKGVDILVATPGRLLDLMNQGHAKLGNVSFFVLDEADRMFDMGFIKDVRRIASSVSKQRQTLMFSATMPGDISKLAHEILKNPEKVEIAPQGRTIEKIDQSVYFISAGSKRALLSYLLADSTLERVIVFTRTKRGANRVAEALEKTGVPSEAIHGNKSQNARQRALDAFSRGRARVLVATDLAARGIDVQGVTHVINYELPAEAESYVHRIGRTARAGASGVALSFCDGSERGQLKSIERLTNQRLAVLQAPANEDMPQPVAAQQPAQRDETQREERGERRGHRPYGQRNGHRGGPRREGQHRDGPHRGERPQRDHQHRDHQRRDEAPQTRSEQPHREQPHREERREHYRGGPHHENRRGGQHHNQHQRRDERPLHQGERPWTQGDYRDAPREERGEGVARPQWRRRRFGGRGRAA